MGAIKVYAADKWFSACIRHRAGYACEHCHLGFTGLVQGYECCHIYGRANRSTRWCTMNAVALCGGCHRHFTSHPLAFHAWLAKYLGQGHLDLLRERFNQTLKTTSKVRAEISKHYKAEFDRMLADGTIDLVDF